MENNIFVFKFSKSVINLKNNVDIRKTVKNVQYNSSGKNVTFAIPFLWSLYIGGLIYL